MDDKLLILEDTNGDGKADKRTVFAGDLNNPTGFEFYNGGVIVAQAPNLVFLKDTNGDDKYDVKQIILGGLDTADTHHTMNSFTFDPGGALYFREGHLPPHAGRNAVGSDGAAGGRRRVPLRAADGEVRGLHSDELPEPARARLRLVGPRHRLRRDRRPAVLRAVVLDEEVLPGDGDEQGAAPGQRPHASGRRRGDPVEPSLPRGDAGQHDRPQHDRVQGTAELQAERGRRRAEVGPKSSRSCSRPTRTSARSTPKSDRTARCISSTGRTRSSGTCSTTCATRRATTMHGRVYRVTYPGRPLLKPAKIAGEPIDRLLDLLKEPEDRVRYRAKIELSARDTKDVMTRARRRGWVDSIRRIPNYEHHMMEALWVQQWHNRVDEKLLNRMLRSKEPWARAAATRVLCYWRDRVQNPLALLKTQANDEHPAVRLEAVRAASFFRSPDAAAVAMTVRDHPQDRFLEYTLDQTMKTLTSLGRPATTAAAPADAPPRRGCFRICRLPRCAAACAIRACRSLPIGTIPEQMLFDVKWFVVEAGKPVRVVLTNADAMPHNLVIGQPGSVNAIGTEAATMPPPTDPNARAYVPTIPHVLQATKLIQRGESDRSTSPRPSHRARTSFVCSFPGHWVRMYGVMLVVPSLDAVRDEAHAADRSDFGEAVRVTEATGVEMRGAPSSNQRRSL